MSGYFEKETRLFHLSDQIHKLYTDIIETFQSYDRHIVYNPNNCRYLTEEMFVEWIIVNNPEIEKLVN